MTNKRNVLLISHDAYRTGGPVMVMNMAQLLTELGSSFYFLIRNPVGELMEDFRKMGPTYLPSKETFLDKVKRKIKGGPVVLLPSLPSFDLVISNTITNGALYPELACKNVPIVTYVHELEIAAKTYTSKDDLEKVVKYTDVFAVPSLAVQQFLTDDLGVSLEKIYRFDYYIPNDEEPISTSASKSSSPFVVGAVGTTDWRKGPDLFLAVAKEYIIQYPNSPILFKWKGANFDSIEYQRMAYEVKKAGLGEVVRFERADADLLNFYKSINLFLLTSREDPYPLVVLEAAKHTMPTVCFESSGGITEFIQESGGGKLVPFLSISAMAKAIHSYVENPEKLHEDGRNALLKLKERHYDKARIGAQFEALLKKCEKR